MTATTSEEWLQKKSPPSLFQPANTAPPSPPESDSASEHSYNNRSSSSSLTVHSAYHAIKHELTEILRIFSLSTNTWLPIVTEPQLNHLKSHNDHPPDIETCLLLLSIYIITKEPPEGGSLEGIYSVLKSLHSNLHTTNVQAIPVIQCGMLLALYEQGQSLHQVSYMTIGGGC